MRYSLPNPKHRIGRRTFLRSAGVALALPLLDAMIPSAFGKQPASPRRMVVVFNDMGFLPEDFFPSKAGKDFALSPYLDLIGAFRKDFTVFSGVSHPQPRRWREAHGLEPFHAFRQDLIVNFNLFGNRDYEPPLQGSGPRRNFHDG